MSDLHDFWRDVLHGRPISEASKAVYGKAIDASDPDAPVAVPTEADVAADPAVRQAIADAQARAVAAQEAAKANGF